MMKILNFGSLNIDYVYQVEHMVREGETIRAKTRHIYCGGKGLNQSIALANAGARVYHAGVIGMDGAMLKEELDKHGVESGLIKCTNGVSSHTVIQVDETGNNSILFFADDQLDADTAYIREVLSNFGEGDYILLQNELNNTHLIMEEAHKKGMRIVLNPSPMNEKLSGYPLEYVDIFMMNEIEGFEMTGKTESDEILERMQELYPNTMTVLTLGEKGACCLENGKILFQEACRVRAVDTTAAGDTFTGYFLAEYLKTGKTEAALALAAKAAAIAVTHSGAADSIPFRREVQ